MIDSDLNVNRTSSLQDVIRQDTGKPIKAQTASSTGHDTVGRRRRVESCLKTLV
jgi:hypothetical protein